MLETTTNLQPDTIEALQELIEINIDSVKGLRTAADRVENASVAQYFRTLAAERDGFAKELQSFVELNNIEPKSTGSAKGALHRWWTSIHGMIRDGDEHVVLSDAEVGEDAIKHKYEGLLRSTAGSPLNRILTEQYKRVKAGHDHVRDLRDTAKAAKQK